MFLQLDMYVRLICAIKFHLLTYLTLIKTCAQSFWGGHPVALWAIIIIIIYCTRRQRTTRHYHHKDSRKAQETKIHIN